MFDPRPKPSSPTLLTPKGRREISLPNVWRKLQPDPTFLIREVCQYPRYRRRSDKLTRVSFFHGCGEHDRADDTDRAGDNKRSLGRDLPQQAADGGRRRDRKTANQIIEPDRTRAQIVPSKVDDHRLARRFADFAQAADDEGNDQQRKARGKHHGQRKQRETKEGGDHERLAPHAIGNLARWNVNQNRSGHLNRDQRAVTRHTEVQDVGYIENGKDTSHAFTRPDD